MVDIGPPPSGILFYEATAISSNGTIVGSMGNNNSGSSFIWTKATGIKRIPVTSSFATGINRGFVIGNSNCLLPGPCDPNNLRAFIWSRRLGSFDLGTLPGQTSSFASGINSRLQVVGDSGNPTQFAFLWTPRFGMVDLNQLIRAPGWVLNNALSINDRAQIVGYGMLNGVLHGFLLTVQRRDKH